MTTIPKTLESVFAPELRERFIALRRDLHRNPELSEREFKTADRLEAELNAIDGVEARRVTDTGLVARIAGKDSSAPVIAVRGDIDALPVQEDTGLPFASENSGVMHACGHDVHATWTIATAHLLASKPAGGDVLIVLQPAEEVGRGAAALLETGALDGVAMIFGGHVDRRFAVGEVVAQAGPMAAATDTFEVDLQGQGGHGARPHESRDPIIAAAALIGSLHHIVSRSLNPADAGVVTVGKMNAGSAPNVIPDSAHFAGTLRSMTPETRQTLRKEVERRTAAIADTYGVEATVTVKDGTPPIMNDPVAAEFARAAVESLLGPEGLATLPGLNMGGEDFAYYLERMPGCFLRIGAREPGGEFIPGHSSRFYADEAAIFTGAAVLAQAARNASAALFSTA